MFDLSWSHILIVLVVALVVVGPKDLPRLMHMIGRWMGKARAMANEFRKSFDEMARQAELDELRKEISALRNERPLAGLQQSVEHGILPADQTKSDRPKPEETKPDPQQVMMPKPAEQPPEHLPGHPADEAPAKADVP